MKPMTEKTVKFGDAHRLHNHYPLDTAQPCNDVITDIPDRVIRSYPMRHHTADRIASRQRRVRVTTPRRSVPDLWGLVAVVCGVVTVGAVVVLVLLAAGRR